MLVANHKLWVSLLTLVVILLTVIAPLAIDLHGGYLSVALILLLGVPHGATDHILFRHIKKDYDKGWLSRFFVRYFLLMGLFSLTWWVLPGLALLIFLAISAYHFGQSQWHLINADTFSKKLIYLSSGLFVLAAPLLWNYTETAPIVEQLVGQEIVLSTEYQNFIPALLLGFVIIQILVLFFRSKISRQKMAKECGVLLLLTGLFFFTPLLIGFSIYFVFWHSIDSIKDQIACLRAANPDYTLNNYLGQVVPFTLVAFGGMGLFAWLSPAALMTDAWLGQMFILISIVTLPHSILMDAFLEADDDKGTDNTDKQLLRQELNRHTVKNGDSKDFSDDSSSDKTKAGSRKYSIFSYTFKGFTN
jgi:Brp/Blh family beta-carotene 15,15'-monooxygenase